MTEKKYSPEQLERIKAFVADHLCDIEEGIAAQGAKLTFILRHPAFPDSYLIVTNDDLPELRKELDRAIAKPAMGEVPPPPKELFR